MKFQQIIFALNRIIQVLISLEFTLLNIIPKSLVTLQFLKFLIVQIKAYIQGFQMGYQSFLGHRYPNSYSWFSDSVDILFVLITTVQNGNPLIHNTNSNRNPKFSKLGPLNVDATVNEMKSNQTLLLHPKLSFLL